LSCSGNSRRKKCALHLITQRALFGISFAPPVAANTCGALTSRKFLRKISAGAESVSGQNA
jgi:hypothetical protein